MAVMLSLHPTCGLVSLPLYLPWQFESGQPGPRDMRLLDHKVHEKCVHFLVGRAHQLACDYRLAGMASADHERHSTTLLSRSPTLAKISDDGGVTVLTTAGGARRQSMSQYHDTSLQDAYQVTVSAEGQHAVVEPLLPPSGTQAGQLDGKLQFAYNVSWVINIFLFIAKAYAYKLSQSKSVLASLVDSFVDLVSQVVIFIAEWRSKQADPHFPVGKARLETIGVLACACIMSVASYDVIKESAEALYAGFAQGELPELDVSVLMYSVLGAATGLKLIAYILCVALQKKSDSMLALAEDHLNDIMSNVGAAVTSAIAAFVAGAWWADPTGGILISLFILWRWYDIAKSQLDKIVGRGAPEELLQQLKCVAEAHHEQLEVDVLRAYHFGSRFLVEVEVVMPIHFSLKEVHDISLDLQTKIEALHEVERAFVHVDYEKRHEPEHRTERLLAGLPVVSEEVVFNPGASNHASPVKTGNHQVANA